MSPILASQLIANLQILIEKHGDLPIWCRTDYLGPDDTEKILGFILDFPISIEKVQHEWPGQPREIAVLDANA